MAGISSSQSIGGATRQSGVRRAGEAVARAPRILMSWEDWLTFAAVMIVFLTVAASIESAGWVRRMPPMIPTAMAGLLIGLFAARIRAHAALIHPAALIIGAAVVILAAQSYATGDTMVDRLADFRVRMVEWWNIVRAGDISNDNLPFVTLVHSVTFLAAYLGTWSVYRWHNPWLAVIPGGIVLLANIAALNGQPSVAFVVYLVGAMLLVSRMHLQKRQARWKRDGVEYPDFMSLNVAELAIAIVAMVMIAAWAVPLGTQAKAVDSAFDKVTAPLEPRNDFFVRLFHNLGAGGSGNFHDFGDVLPVRGDVKLGTKLLFTVEAPEAGLLRGASYDEYTGVGWKQSERDSERVDGGEIFVSDETSYRDRRVNTITITVRDNEDTILFPGTPLGTNRDAIFRTIDGVTSGAHQVVSRRGLDSGDTYNAVGTESIASPDALRLAGSDYPQWVRDAYLQLPDSLPQRVRDEAVRISAGASNPYDAAVAVEAYLRTFPYNLEVPAAPPGRDTVDYFLFDLQQGYFDYHASGMAVLLRTLGIPARVTVGYAINAENVDVNGGYDVRKDDAYAWVEVFFPEYGWVTFNPTPNRPAGSGSEGVGDGVGDVPVGTPLEPTLEDIFQDLGGVTNTPPGDSIPGLAETPVEGPQPFPWWIAWTLAGALAAVAALAMSGRLAWTWGTGNLPPRVQYWARIQRAARWAGLRSEPEETAREWARRVGESVHMPVEATTLVAGYEEARYGRPDLERSDEEELRTAYRSLRNRLFKRVVRRRERVRTSDDEATF